MLELASEAAGIGSFTWWIPEGVIEASPELERLWGLASGTSETHPEFWTSRLVESDRQHGEAVWGQWKAQRPEDCALDFRIVTPDGGPKWLHLRAKLQYDAAGQLRCMIGINLDITARKQAEEALRRSEFWFRTLADNVPEVLYLYEPARGVTYFNRRVEELTGLPASALQGDGYAELFHPDDRAQTLQLITEAVTTGHPYVRRHRVRVADGSYHWFYGRAVPVEVDGRTQWFGITSDINEQVRLEENLKQTARKLRSANERLARSNRDLQDFALLVAHDLQAPLISMTAAVYSLEEECRESLSTVAQEYVRFLTGSAEHMRALVDTVLQYARLDQKADSGLAPVDCNQLAAHALGLLQAEIQETGAVIRIDPLPTVFAHPGQLAQVFLNLISNALRYRRPEVPPRLRLSATEGEPAWTFVVEDNGLGIETKDHGRIFGMFQRGPGLHKKGFGMGLTICQKVVERHGGRIWVESVPGQGSRFYFTWPKSPVSHDQ